jgi:hypothetical protein
MASSIRMESAKSGDLGDTWRPGLPRASTRLRAGDQGRQVPGAAGLDRPAHAGAARRAALQHGVLTSNWLAFRRRTSHGRSRSSIR